MRRKPRLALLAVLLASGLVVSTTALGEQSASSSRAVIKVAFNKTLKKEIVVDGSGRTLYMFTGDTNGTSACPAINPNCPKIFPALKSVAAPVAGKGIKASLLDTTPDGKHQVRYNRHPLYYFRGGFGLGRGDTKSGDVGAQGFEHAWYVLSPKGTPIRK